jgi:site-specific DNA recombinase
MQAVNGKVGSQSVKVYVCHKHRTEGNAICANTLRRPVVDVDAAVTDWISANVLREELVVETLREIRRRLAERARATNAEIPRLEERATTLRQELQKLAEALLATEEKPHTIVRLIAEREKALRDVQARLAAFSAAPGAVDLETRRLEREARRRLAELRALLGRNPNEGRVALEALLDGQLSFRPIETPDGKRYEITGKIALGSLFTIEGVPRGTVGMVNTCSYGELDGWTLPIRLVA